jgi:N-methylhydantoinase A
VADVTFARSADMRYAGQEHTVNVPLPDGRLEEARRSDIRQRFDELHEKLYSFRLESPAEIVNYRLTAFAAVPTPKPRHLAEGRDASRASKGARQVHFDELGLADAGIYERDRLGAGALVEGAAVIEEPAASTVVFPDQTARVDEHGNVIVEPRS